MKNKKKEKSQGAPDLEKIMKKRWKEFPRKKQLKLLAGSAILCGLIFAAGRLFYYEKAKKDIADRLKSPEHGA